MALAAPHISGIAMTASRPEGKVVDQERRAFERRMGAAWPDIVRLVERLLAWPGAASEVEDVAQDVFLAAWNGRGEFRGEAEWTTWVYAIAVRRSRNAARSRRRRERWFGRLLPGSTLDQNASEAGAVSEVVSEETRRALSKLKHADRELLVLRYLEERTIDELADWLELSRGALDARLSRARGRLRDGMDAAAREATGEELP